jgi:hypothetical protein
VIRLLRFIALRRIKTERLRTLITLFGIALGVAIVLAIELANRATTARGGDGRHPPARPGCHPADEAGFLTPCWLACRHRKVEGTLLNEETSRFGHGRGSARRRAALKSTCASP